MTSTMVDCSTQVPAEMSAPKPGPDRNIFRRPADGPALTPGEMKLARLPPAAWQTTNADALAPRRYPAASCLPTASWPRDRAMADELLRQRRRLFGSPRANLERAG